MNCYLQWSKVGFNGFSTEEVRYLSIGTIINGDTGYHNQALEEGMNISDYDDIVFRADSQSLVINLMPVDSTYVIIPLAIEGNMTEPDNCSGRNTSRHPCFRNLDRYTVNGKEMQTEDSYGSIVIYR